jgi:hypothetical protein
MGVGGMTIGCAMGVGGMTTGVSVGVVPMSIEQLRVRIRIITNQSNRVDLADFIMPPLGD